MSEPFDHAAERQRQREYAALERESLAAKLDLLKAKGVSRFVDPGGGSIEFFPQQSAEEPSKPEIDADLCRCGHPSYQHVQGLCAMGCKEEKCAGPAT